MPNKEPKKKSDKQINPKELTALPSSFYLRDTLEVAQNLLGKGLFYRKGRITLLAEIVEVEAYKGNEDAASHAFRGLTKRNWPMFERGGICYVYLSYGINYCMNVVTGKRGEGEAVLLRAAVPLLGLEEMARRRNQPLEHKTKLLSGPGKLTQAFGIDLSANGQSFAQDHFKLVDLGKRLHSDQWGASARIGISRALDKHYRFCVTNCPWLSRLT